MFTLEGWCKRGWKGMWLWGSNQKSQWYCRRRFNWSLQRSSC